MSTSGLTCAYGRRSALAWNELYIGWAAASNWLIGGRFRISSIVRSMLLVEYIDESTTFRLVYGLTTKAMVRWASMWSGPFWASSSTTKIAVSFQNLLLLTASTTRPNPRSLSATIAIGVHAPTLVHAVWSFGSRITMNCGISPSF